MNNPGRNVLSALTLLVSAWIGASPLAAQAPGSIDKNELKQIPLGAAIQELKKPLPSDSVPSINAIHTQHARANYAEGLPGPVPAGFTPVLSVPMSPTAMAGVAISAKAMSERNVPTVDKEGRAVYAFGTGLPTLVCAPLRVCTLELQMGEKILGEPQLGDSSRWIITPVNSGSDATATPLLVIKPKSSGLDTTMVISTDRRTYYMRLISEPEEFMARTAFTYSDDEHVQWNAYLQKQAHEAQVKAAETRTATTATIDNLHFNYSITGKGDASFKPVRVLDDGEKTYIQMPESAKHQDLPTLVVVTSAGNEMVNFRVQNNTYIVDRLFTHGALLIGTGKHQQRFDLKHD